MKKQSQYEYVEKLLLNYGKVSRNWCLEQRITRLGAIICDMNKNGFIIKGGFEKKNGGKDYVYTAEKIPYKQVKYTTPENKIIIRFVREKVDA